ncbi:MAG: hypothetical protein AB1894_09305 [Chloroflexota bacterium]
MKYGWIVLLVTVLAGCAPLPATTQPTAVQPGSAQPGVPTPIPTSDRSEPAGLPDLGPAPELNNQVWLNSPPLRLADLRGKVVLLDMWTFG